MKKTIGEIIETEYFTVSVEVDFENGRLMDEIKNRIIFMEAEPVSTIAELIMLSYSCIKKLTFSNDPMFQSYES